MYRRYCLLVNLHRRSSEPSPKAVEAAEAASETSDAAGATASMSPTEDGVDDWERRYRVAPGPSGLAAVSGLLDEEAYLTLSQAVLAAALQRKGSSGGRRAAAAGGPRLLLLAGPAGSGKSHLIRCLAAELPDSLVLSVPAAGLLPRGGGRGRGSGADDAGAAVRRLFEFARSRRRQTCVLAIENLELLLENEAAPEPCRAASRVVQELAACWAACRRDARLAAVIVTTRRPWLAKPPLASLFYHRLALRRPDALRRRQVLANVAAGSDSFAPFQGSLNAGDFGRLLDIVADGADGMSPGDLIAVLHHAANYPLKQMVYRRVRFPESDAQLRLDPRDIHWVLAECQASVSEQEWQQYADWAAATAVS